MQDYNIYSNKTIFLEKKNTFLTTVAQESSLKMAYNNGSRTVIINC